MATGPDPVGVAGGHSVTVPGAPTGEDLERAHAFELIHGPRVFEQLAQLTSAVQALIAQDVPQLIANNVYLGNKLDEWTKLAQRLGQEKRDLATYIEQLEARGGDVYTKHLEAKLAELEGRSPINAAGLGTPDLSTPFGPREPVLELEEQSDPMRQLADRFGHMVDVIEARERRAEERETGHRPQRVSRHNIGAAEADADAQLLERLAAHLREHGSIRFAG